MSSTASSLFLTRRSIMVGVAGLMVAAHVSARPREIAIYTFVASRDGMLATAHLIIGPDEVVLIDSTFLTADADAIAKRLMRTGKRLSRVIITHAHPDHFLGAAALKAHFPDAQYLAREQTAAEIKKISGFARNAMAADYGDRFNSAAITFAPLQGGELRIGSAVLPLIDFVGGESHHQLAILLPDQSEVIASDLLYNGTHLYLADQDFAAWRQNLDRLSALGAARARPGHGQPGRTKDLVAKTLEYMAAFEEEAEKAPDAERLKARMISRYPNLAGVRLLEFSAASMFPADPSDR